MQGLQYRLDASRIEDAAIPVLTRPIQGDPTTLSGDQIDTVARWAFLKCLVVTLATHKGELVPPVLCECMRRHQRPPRSVALLMARYGGVRHPLYAAAGPVSFDIKIGDGEPTKRYAYLLTISVGHVVFQVFGHHFAGIVDLKPTNWKRDATCRIWPKPDNPISWPPRVHLTDKTLFEFGPRAARD